MSHDRPAPAFGLVIVGDEILSGKRADKHMPKVIELLSEADASYDFIDHVGSTFYFKTDLKAPLGRVIAIDRVPERLEMARTYGEAETIDFDKVDVYDQLQEMTGVKVNTQIITQRKMKEAYKCVK